jgi:hypothetical protein
VSIEEENYKMLIETGMLIEVNIQRNPPEVVAASLERLGVVFGGNAEQDMRRTVTRLKSTVNVVE